MPARADGFATPHTDGTPEGSEADVAQRTSAGVFFGGYGFESRHLHHWIAQRVEHRTDNPKSQVRLLFHLASTANSRSRCQMSGSGGWHAETVAEGRPEGRRKRPASPRHHGPTVGDGNAARASQGHAFSNAATPCPRRLCPLPASRPDVPSPAPGPVYPVNSTPTERTTARCSVPDQGERDDHDDDD